MIVNCKNCGAELRLNRNLAGTMISCPECFEKLTVPKGPPPPPAPRRTRGRSERARRGPAAETGSAPSPEPRAARPRPGYSLSLFGAQLILILLALSCFAGAFLRTSWEPPISSYFRENQLILIGVAILLLLAATMAIRAPILATLGVVVLILVACTLHYRFNRILDASRVLALSLSMVALWFAMEHRGVT